MASVDKSIFENLKIDSSKPTPYHTQVHDILDSVIQTHMQPGDQLPSEPRLCDLFGVSRTVIRQALAELLRDGTIFKVMGKGTFVAEPKISESLISRLTGFYEDMVEQGHSIVSKVLQQEVVEASSKVARNLDISTGDKVVAIRRLRFVNDIPLQLVTTYIPEIICPALVTVDFTNQSLYAYLQQMCGIKIDSGKRFIEAVLANEEEALLLRINKGSPLILIDSVSYLEDGSPLEYYHAVHRSDRARFEVNLVRFDESQ